MLIEILVALAFLAIVTGSVMKIRQAALDYDRISTDRLRQQLAAENIAERLSLIPFDELQNSADEITKESNSEVSVDPFTCELGTGMHVAIKVSSESGPVSHHFWRLEPSS